jgi:hypothetical protein
MLDKTELRKKDFVTSVILIVFGIWMLFYTIREIPMKDSWGGVMNVWYVSPGLFALCIGILIIIMGVILLRRAIRDGGARKFVDDFSRREKESTGKTLRLFAILLVIFVYVYLLIPRIDYFLSTLVCLMVFISFFYLDGPGFLKKFFTFYFLGCLVLLGCFLIGLDKQLTKIFPYAMDALVFGFFLAYVGYCRRLIGGDALLKKRLKISLIMSIIPSLVLIPSFKYFLLVPLPVEGGFIELMNIVRYSLR